MIVLPKITFYCHLRKIKLHNQLQSKIAHGPLQTFLYLYGCTIRTPKRGQDLRDWYTLLFIIMVNIEPQLNERLGFSYGEYFCCASYSSTALWMTKTWMAHLDIHIKCRTHIQS